MILCYYMFQGVPLNFKYEDNTRVVTGLLSEYNNGIQGGIPPSIVPGISKLKKPDLYCAVSVLDLADKHCCVPIYQYLKP